MARRGRKKKKADFPEPFDSMLEIAGAGIWYLLTSGLRDRLKKKGKKPDPYMATGAGVASGRIKNTGDLIKFGGVLDAMGAFDDSPNDNRYAWRLNCEDGTEYGIDPEDYETRDEYNEALRDLKYERHGSCESGDDFDFCPKDNSAEDDYEEAAKRDREYCEGEEQPDTNDAYTVVNNTPVSYDELHVYIYCKVMVGSEEMWCRTEDRSVKKGCIVRFLNSKGEICEGEVTAVEHHMEITAPVKPEVTPVVMESFE